jgi:uncharacterized membrane protein
MTRFIKSTVWIVFAVPVAYLAIIWSKLPERVPMHYNLKGEVDRYGNKTELLLLTAFITAINIGVYFLLVNINRIDPKKKYRMDNLPRMRAMAFIINIFISAIACFILYSIQNEVTKFNPNFIVVGIGILFTLLGNYFYSIKPNYFAGIRTPWALENENNWKLTHQLGGKLWFGGGIAIVVVGLLLKETFLFVSLMAIILVMVFVPIVYSYRLYAKEKRSNR